MKATQFNSAKPNQSFNPAHVVRYGYPFNPVFSYFSLLTFFCFFTSEIKKQKKVSHK